MTARSGMSRIESVPVAQTPEETRLRGILSSRRRFALLAGTLILGSAWLLVSCQETRPRPDIVFILIDTLRADHFPDHGRGDGSLPNLERLVQNGVVFDRVIAPSSWTKTSMASIVTSQDPARHGVRSVEDALPDWLATLAGELAGGGYHTIGVNTNPWLKARFGFDTGFAVYETLKLGDGSFTRGTQANRVALDRVEEAPHGDPVFLYVHYMDVHAPYRPPAPVYSAPPISGPGGGAIPDDRLELLYRKGGLDAPGVQQRVLDLYGGEIRSVDAAIGELLEGLEGIRGSRDTIHVVTSDHGESFREHGTTEHGWNLYPEVYEIPLVFHAPSRLPSGVRIEAQVRGIDVAPTLLSLAGIDAPASFEGEPLLPMKPGTIRDRIATGAVGLNDYLPNLDYVAVVTPDSLYLRERRNDRVEFYDLEADPGALDDLGPDHPRARLLAELEPLPGDTKAPRETLDPETIEQLRSLGYIE